ncbi:hypothetical protein ACFE04_027601 [Oxalis oulophora]
MILSSTFTGYHQKAIGLRDGVNTHPLSIQLRLDLFMQCNSLPLPRPPPPWESTVAKDLGDNAMFLAHVTRFYPIQLADRKSNATQGNNFVGKKHGNEYF